MSLEEFLDAPETAQAYRGYLAGTNRATTRFGLTTLQEAEAYVQPVMEALGQSWWARCTPDGQVEPMEETAVRAVLRTPEETAVLVTADDPVDPERIAAVANRDRRRTPSTLPALLDVAHLVAFPESARDGLDWRFFCASPMRERLAHAFRAHPTDDVRRFFLPYENARTKSKFYFETWQLTEESLPNYVEEV